jgi:3-methyladenine DNA glycosylase/8-oxoguanine DNA glycosylase
MKFSIPARPPFNFLSVVNSHGWRQLAPFSFEEEDDTLCYVLRLSTGRVIELKFRDGKDGVLLETEKLDAAERREVKEKASWIFGLNLDFSRFYAASRGEPKLAHAKKLARGRVLRSPSLFEDVIKTILTTNTLWTATKNMTRKLVDELGASTTGRKSADLPLSAVANSKAFPTPEAIAASSPEFLKEKIRVGYRAPAIHQLAVRVASGAFDLEALKTSQLPTIELRKELLSINGVGPYAAANLLLILGRTDFIPIDSWALKLVSHEWYDGKPVTPRDVEKHFERWGEFKGLAFWFWDWKYQE